MPDCRDDQRKSGKPEKEEYNEVKMSNTDFRTENKNRELKNKNLHLVKADKENFWTLMDLRVTNEQRDFDILYVLII